VAAKVVHAEGELFGKVVAVDDGGHGVTP
jgi:hypothetical protein